jgi:predicted DNA binding CopG/RHH family protein
MIKTKTWLPVFNGFYGTIWDTSDSDSPRYDLKEQGLTKEEINEAYCLKCYDEAYREYEHRVCREAVSFIDSELSGYATKIKFEELIRPQYYNYSNDSINVEIELSDDNIAAIKEYISKNGDKWQDYLTNHYTSYDGFWSGHANDARDNEWLIDNALQDSHNLGAVLNFICKNENITEADIYYAGNGDYIFLSGDTVRNELLAKGWYDDKPEVLAEILATANKYNTNREFVLGIIDRIDIDGELDAIDYLNKLTEKIKKIKNIKELNDTVMPLQFKGAQ